MQTKTTKESLLETLTSYLLTKHDKKHLGLTLEMLNKAPTSILEYYKKEWKL